jgi:outer membrane protein assembly factor BamB
MKFHLTAPGRSIKTLAIFCILWSSLAFAADSGWPQWRGANRDGISKEMGLIKTWPADGPKVLWKAPIGEGYSSVAVSAGKIYTMDSKGEDEFVVAMDLASGKELWRTRTDSVFYNDQGNGPRSTPTVDGNMVYAVGASGALVALNAQNGKVVWQHNLIKEFESEIPRWGTSTAPLVEKDVLLVDVGGKSGYSLMAFNKTNGSVVWKTHTDKQGYSAPIAVTVGNVRQILFFTGTALVSVSPQGNVYWKYPWRTDYDANIATPVFIAPDKIFISSSYGTGAAVLKISSANGASSFQEVWRNKVMENHFNSSVLYQGNIYGFDNAILKCIDASTGAEKWKQSGFGKGSLILADGELIVLGERGQLALVEANPASYVEKAKTQAMQGKTWTMPALADGKLILRNQKEIVALDFKAR